MSVAFSPDNQRIVSSSGDNTIRIWHTKTGEPFGNPLKGHEASVMSVAFSPDSQRIVSASWDKTVRLWDANTGATLDTPLKGHESSVMSVSFSPDSQQIVSSSDDKSVRIWNIAALKPVLSRACHQLYYHPTLKYPIKGDDVAMKAKQACESYIGNK